MELLALLLLELVAAEGGMGRADVFQGTLCLLGVSAATAAAAGAVIVGDPGRRGVRYKAFLVMLCHRELAPILDLFLQSDVYCPCEMVDFLA